MGTAQLRSWITALTLPTPRPPAAVARSMVRSDSAGESRRGRCDRSRAAALAYHDRQITALRSLARDDFELFGRLATRAWSEFESLDC